MESIVFLANNFKKEDEDIICQITSELEIIPNLKAVSVSYNPREYSILPEDEIVFLESLFEFNKEKLFVTLHKNTFDEKKNTLEVSIFYDNQCDEFNQNLYDFKIKVKNILKIYYKEIFINQDTQNQKICTELYTIVHKVENLFRHIVNLYMVNKFGAKWFENNITNVFQSKVSEYSKWYRDNYTVFVDIQSALFNIQIDDLITMLKDSYINTLSKSEMDAVQMLKKKLGEDRISLVVKKEYIQLKPIWESEFSAIFDASFENDWDTYTKMRNMIAHNKLICLKLRQDMLYMSERLEKSLLEKLRFVNIKFKSIEESHIKKLYSDYEEKYYMEEAGLEKTPNMEDVIQEITEDESYSKLLNIVEEYIDDYKLEYDDLINLLEIIKDEKLLNKYAFNEFQERVLLLYEIFYNSGIIQDYSKVNLIRHTEMNIKVRDILIDEADLLINKMIKLENSKDTFIVEYFELGELARIKDYRNNTLSIKITGYILPMSGTSDSLDIDIYINDIKNNDAHGGIERSYGKYSIHEEEGYAMSERLDEFNVELAETIDFVENFCINSIKDINTYYNQLDELFLINK